LSGYPRAGSNEVASTGISERITGETMGSIKTLCDWKKEQIANCFEEIRAIVVDPHFICRKCGRVAGEEKWLCRPLDLYVGAGKLKQES